MCKSKVIRDPLRFLRLTQLSAPTLLFCGVEVRALLVCVKKMLDERA